MRTLFDIFIIYKCVRVLLLRFNLRTADEHQEFLPDNPYPVLIAEAYPTQTEVVVAALGALYAAQNLLK